MKNIFLTVIIPCYNEQENLNAGVLKAVFEYLKKQKYTWEVIVSDDGSTDQSREIVKKQIVNLNNFSLLENPHGGKPLALGYAIKKACGEYILFSDMDQSTPISELDKLIPPTKDNNTAIIGSRGISRKDFPLYRKFGAIVFSTFRRILILPEINDTQCGFKLFRADVLKKVFPKLEYFRVKKEIKGWSVSSFDVELLHIIKKEGGLIKEIVVKWSDKDESKGKGGGLNKYIRESKEMVFQIIRVKLYDLKGLYN